MHRIRGHLRHRFVKAVVDAIMRFNALKTPGVMCIPIWLVIRSIVEVVFRWTLLLLFNTTEITTYDMREYASATLGRGPSDLLMIFFTSNWCVSVVAYAIVYVNRFRIYYIADKVREFVVTFMLVCCVYMYFRAYNVNHPYFL